MSENLEERKLGPGHVHIEGYCAVREGRTWAVKSTGCMKEGTDIPEPVGYRSSLAMVRDYVWMKMHGM